MSLKRRIIAPRSSLHSELAQCGIGLWAACRRSELNGAAVGNLPSLKTLVDFFLVVYSSSTRPKNNRICQNLSDCWTKLSFIFSPTGKTDQEAGTLLERMHQGIESAQHVFPRSAADRTAALSAGGAEKTRPSRTVRCGRFSLSCGGGGSQVFGSRVLGTERPQGRRTLASN